MHEALFQVGQLAETRSLATGFRGAWFRCKIKKIREKNGKLFYRMEYVDYPDQKLEWIKVYQKPPKRKYSELMVRPCYPTIYLESDMPDMSTISEEIVIIDDKWMVGDLVDFLADGCYWSGTVAKILEDGMFKIDLFPPPKGEGSSYEAFYKDIRPSLDWNPKKGWKVPKLAKEGQRRICARLIKPQHSDRDAVVQTSLSTSLPHAADRDAVVQTSLSTSLPHAADRDAVVQTSLSTSLPHAADRDAVVQTSLSTSLSRFGPFLDHPEGCITTNNTETGMDVEVGDLGTRKANYSGKGQSTRILAESAENMRMKEINDGLSNEQPSKKLRKDKNIRLDSMFLHSIEDAILDLEDLINRVKWMKGLLEFGMPMSSASQSLWQLRQHIDIT